MSAINLEVASYWELLALHNVLMEAKFHTDPNKPEIQVSPHVKSLANKVFDALISSQISLNTLTRRSTPMTLVPSVLVTNKD